MTETAEIYGGIRAKIAAVRAALDANYREYCDLKEQMNCLQGECPHEEYKASNRFDKLEYCVVCGYPRVMEWRARG